MSLGLENGAVTSQFNLMQMLKHQISEFWEAFNTMKRSNFESKMLQILLHHPMIMNSKASYV